MNVIHRIVYRDDSDVAKIMEQYGYPIKSGITAFEIGENDKNWEAIKAIIEKYGTTDLQFYTTFTKKEMDSANFYVLSGNWYFDYPQPEDDFGYESITYDNTNYCKKCGTGLKQVSNFSAKRNPKWGSKNIARFNWVYDEFFVSKELKDTLQQTDINFKFKEVLKFKKEQFLDDFFQVEVTDECRWDADDFAIKSTCDVCKLDKCYSISNGFFPMPLNTDFDIARSNLYFGWHTHSAFKAIVISKKVYNIFTELKVKGVRFIPCQNSTDT